MRPMSTRRARSPRPRRRAALLFALAALLAPVAACSEDTVVSSTSSPTGTANDENAHGPTDVAFAQGLIPVLDEHLELRRAFLGTPGIDQRFTDLANQPTIDQQNAIATLNSSLETWGEDTVDPEARTSEAAQQLENLTGEEADIHFLESYRASHERALELAGEQIENGRNPSMTSLATEIEHIWSTEVADIDRFLAQG